MTLAIEHQQLHDPSRTAPRPKARRLRSYIELTKARLTLLVVLTTAAGFVLAAEGAINWVTLAITLLGTALAAGGTSALNQWLEIDRDGAMERTANRPLPGGHLSMTEAFIAGVLMVAAGVAVVFFLVNPLAGFLTLFTATVYILIYTPLKSRTTLNTLIGAVCGALPPMIGWAAATGALGLGAWLLGGVLFVWQLPHFLALGWYHREDYQRGGFRMLPVFDRSGALTGRITILTTLLLIPLSLMIAMFEVSGWIFAGVSIALGLAFVWMAVRMYLKRSRASARAVFLASIAYLPLLLLVMVLDGRQQWGGTGVSPVMHEAGAIARIEQSPAARSVTND